MRQILALLGAAFFLVACASSNPKQPPEIKTLPVPALPGSARSAHFQAVHQHLDLGGTMYFFVDVENDLVELAGSINEMVEGLSGEQTGLDSIDFVKLTKDLGLHSVVALGMSSYRDGKVFHNKAFLLRQGAPEGLLRVFGGAPHDFEVGKLAPANTDWAFESDLHLRPIYEVVAAILRDTQGPERAAALLSKLNENIPDFALSYKQLIDRLDTRILGVLRVNEDRLLGLPDLSFKIPHFEFLLGVDNLGICFDALANFMTPPLFVQSEDEKFRVIEMGEAAPGDLGVYRLLLAKTKSGDRVFFASSRSFLDEYFSNKPGLSTTESFKQALAGLPAQGNGLSYTSPALVGKFEKPLKEIAAAFLDTKTVISMFLSFLPAPGVPTASVHSNLPDGILFSSNSTSSHKASLVLFNYANISIIGILAAIAIPNFINYTRKAKASEVGEMLQRCYQGVVSYYERSCTRSARKTQKCLFPPAMARPVCPENKTLESLDDSPGVIKADQFQRGGSAEAFGAIGFLITEPVYGCYQITSDAPGQQPQDAQTFTCHAWTDIDSNGQRAHWLKTGTYSAATNSFQEKLLERDPSSDEY